MVALRSFCAADAPVLQQRYADMPASDIQAMIADWNRGEFQGRAFQMLAILKSGAIVGAISLYQRSASVVSIGPEIFPAYRRQGFAKEAMRLVLGIAHENGYRIVVQQVRCDNAPSIALHKSLGFETDSSIFTNGKGNKILLFYMPL